MIQEILALTTVGCAVCYTGFSFYRSIFPRNKKQIAGCSGCSATSCNASEFKIK